MTWHNKNFGKSPFDPDYLDGYDPEADLERYESAMEEKYEREKEGD